MYDRAQIQNGKPTVCVDLDGVLNQFDKWISDEHLHPIRPGAAEFLCSLSQSYRIVIFTCRWHEFVRKWLIENEVAQYVSDITDKKPPAMVYLDDRAVCFTGDFDAALKQIESFRPFWNV